MFTLVLKLWKLFIYLLLKFLRNFIARKHNFPYAKRWQTFESNLMGKKNIRKNYKMKDFKIKYFFIAVLFFQLSCGQEINQSEIIGTWQLFENKKTETNKIDIGELVLFDEKGDTLKVEQNRTPKIIDKRFSNIYLKIEKDYLIEYFGGLGKKQKYVLNGNIIDFEDKRQFKIIEFSKNKLLISEPRTLLYNKVEVDLSDYQLMEN